jgi:site-specific recombinase XerD
VNTSTPTTVQEPEPRGPLDDAIASFITQLQTAGYAKESVRNKRTVVRTFADWLRRRHISGQAINESHVAAFLKRKPGTLPPRLKSVANPSSSPAV